MKKDITELYYYIDNFVKECKETMSKHQLMERETIRKPTREPGINESEIITIMLLFQQSPCKNFKYFYQSYLQLYRNDFKELPTYERFVTLMPRVLYLLVVLICSLFTPGKNIAFIDSTSLAVCHPKRISRNKVFKGLAALGKTTKGWFFGLKLHIIIDEMGNLIRVKLTPGNTDDRAVVPHMTKGYNGLLFGDKGYISRSLFSKLIFKGVRLVTGIKRNMANVLMPLHEKIFLRKRSLVETVFDYLKNKLQLEHTRHRSPFNAFVHIISTLIVYQLKPTKPSISFSYLLPNP